MQTSSLNFLLPSPDFWWCTLWYPPHTHSHIIIYVDGVRDCRVHTLCTRLMHAVFDHHRFWLITTDSRESVYVCVSQCEIGRVCVCVCVRIYQSQFRQTVLWYLTWMFESARSLFQVHQQWILIVSHGIDKPPQQWTASNIIFIYHVYCQMSLNKSSYRIDAAVCILNVSIRIFLRAYLVCTIEKWEHRIFARFLIIEMISSPTPNAPFQHFFFHFRI